MSCLCHSVFIQGWLKWHLVIKLNCHEQLGSVCQNDQFLFSKTILYSPVGFVTKLQVLFEYRQMRQPLEQQKCLDTSKCIYSNLIQSSMLFLTKEFQLYFGKMLIFATNALSNKLIMNGSVVFSCFCPIIFCIIL